MAADRAQAAKIAAQGQQVMGALELYHAEHGVYPNTLDDLVTTEYLKSIPVAFAPDVAAVQAALAAGTRWVLTTPGQPVIALSPVSPALCKSYNAAQAGISTPQILQAPHKDQLLSCYGPDEAHLTILQAKSSEDLLAAASNPAAPFQIGTVVTSPVPAATSSDTSIDGWLVLGAVALPASSLEYVTVVGGQVVTQVTFADTLVGEVAIKELYLRNAGTTPVTFGALAATIAPPFLAYSQCDGVTLAPGEQCSLEVDFAPGAPGAFSGGAYALTPNVTGMTSATVPVSGTAIAPAPSVLSLTTTSVAAYFYALLSGVPDEFISQNFYQHIEGLVDPEPIDSCHPSYLEQYRLPQTATAEWVLFSTEYFGAHSSQWFALTVPAGNLQILEGSYSIGASAPVVFLNVATENVFDVFFDCNGNRCDFYPHQITLPFANQSSPLWNITFPQDGQPFNLSLTYSVNGGAPQVISHSFVVRVSSRVGNLCG